MSTQYSNAYAYVLYHAGLEKQANALSRAVSAGWGALTASGKRVMDAGSEFKAFRDTTRQLRGGAAQNEKLHGTIERLKARAAPAAGITGPEASTAARVAAKKQKQLGLQQTNLNTMRQARNDRAWQYAKDVAPAVAVAGGGLGAAGVGTAYALGDADTYSNKMKNYSNNMLGTNFSTQSRIGRLFS